jgi:DNA repair photolyase
MELRDPLAFEQKIFVKQNVVPQFRRDMKREKREEMIAIGTATDPYQPAERRYGRTREILEVFARDRGRHIGLITKSDLIVRDIDVMQQIARANVFGVHLTITTLDAGLARLLEPRAPRPDLRLDAVRKLAGAGIVVGVNPNPIMPGITDSERSLDRLARASRDAGAVTFGGGPLFLMPSAQKVFFPFLEREFPHLLARYRDLYARSAYLGKDYKAELAARVRRIRERYGLASGMAEYRPEVWVEEQGELFA